VQNGLRPFDIISEVAELDELLGTQASEAIVAHGWIGSSSGFGAGIAEIHELVTDLASASKSDPACGLAYMLVAESVTNILNTSTAPKKQQTAATPNPNELGIA